VHLQLVAVPGLRTLTTRRLAGGDAQDLRREANGALDAELLVLCTVNEIRRELLEVLDVAAGQRDADFVDFHAGDGRAGRVIFFFSLSDVTHCWWG